MLRVVCLAIVGSTLVVGGAAAESRMVYQSSELAAAVRQARAGDTITLANGEWKDTQILFTGEGLSDRPITLTAETPGGVILTGQSNLRMAGQYLVVSNLVFRDGWSPTGEIISFRQNRTRRANYSRVTGVVIDGYSKPQRDESDNWIALYGHHNRFDHNQIMGKTNTGTTLVVIRDEEQGLENRHSIDHNYFGHRPTLGSNGGETIRVGTSHDSASDSFTVVSNNWFEHCDGEVEVVSNKSGSNIYRGNVFYESQGAMVLRHGDGNLVEDNVFIGNGVENTGGIRVINRRNTVRNNYMEGLRGTGFLSALTIMYGVPNSPLNRYVQVEEARIEHNSLIDIGQIFLGAGYDDERSAAPLDSRFTDNLIVNPDGVQPFRISGDMAGITFSGNIQSPAATDELSGFEGRDITITRGDTGLYLADASVNAGARRDLSYVARNDVGVGWYPKVSEAASLDSGPVTEVAPGEDTLTAALAAAQPGARLQLGAGRYVVNQVLGLDRPVTIQGPATQEGTQGEALIVFSRPTLFEIGRGGSLKLANLHISGTLAPDEAGNAVIRVRDGAAGYRLLVADTAFSDMKVNRQFNIFAAGPRTLADLIQMDRVSVDGLTGSVLAAHADTNDLGTYNAQWVRIDQSSFRDVTGPAIDLYRGGTDESTFGPRLSLTNTRFDRVGRTGDEPASVLLYGVQLATMTDNQFNESGPVRFFRRVGEPSLFWGGEASDLISNVPATGVRP